MEQPHDRPSAAELVAAVRDFLQAEILDAGLLDAGPLEADPPAVGHGRVRFHTRVAINVLGMVERELTLGPEQATAHAERLAALGFADDAALAAAIRAGDLDDRADEVRAALLASVRDKLLVANPRYR